MAPPVQSPDADRLPVRRYLGALARSWFDLTAEEHRAVLVVLGLFLLGLAVRCCHAPPKTAAPQPPANPGETAVR